MRYFNTAVFLTATIIAMPSNAQQTDAKKLKDQLTGDAKGAASANPQCKLFTQAEISALAGAPMGKGENAAGGSGCMWADKDDETTAMVQIVSAKYFPEPKLVKGFKRLPDVGTKGWVAPDMGWSAGTLIQDEAIVVELSGQHASEASVTALLKEVVKRRKK